MELYIGHLYRMTGKSYEDMTSSAPQTTNFICFQLRLHNSLHLLGCQHHDLECIPTYFFTEMEIISSLSC